MDPALYGTLNEAERYHWWMVARREILMRFLSRRLPAGATLIEIGCGTGYLLDRARDRYRVTGLDSSPEAVEICRAKGLADVHAGAIPDPPPGPPRRFDAVLLLDVIEHLDDDRAALDFAAGLLAPGGLLVVTVPAFMFLWSEHDELAHHKRRYTAGRLRAALEGAGWRIERLTYFNSLLFPVAVLAHAWHRLRGGARRAHHYEFRPGPVNSALRAVFAAEGPLLDAVSFPVGVSVLCAARRGESAGER